MDESVGSSRTPIQRGPKEITSLNLEILTKKKHNSQIPATIYHLPVGILAFLRGNNIYDLRVRWLIGFGNTIYPLQNANLNPFKFYPPPLLNRRMPTARFKPPRSSSPLRPKQRSSVWPLLVCISCLHDLVIWLLSLCKRVSCSCECHVFDNDVVLFEANGVINLPKIILFLLCFSWMMLVPFCYFLYL